MVEIITIMTGKTEKITGATDKMTGMIKITK